MENTINRIVEYASKISDPLAIFLFGSMADATQNVYSDIKTLSCHQF
jgi:hypothetical protein